MVPDNFLSYILSVEETVVPVYNALLVKMSQSEDDFARIESEQLALHKVFLMVIVPS